MLTPKIYIINNTHTFHTAHNLQTFIIKKKKKMSFIINT